MRLLTFKSESEPRHRPSTRAGALIGDLVLDLASAQPFIPSCIREILRRGLLPEVKNLVDNASELDRSHFVKASGVSLMPPVTAPGKIICLGLNYAGHAAEQKKEPPEHPMLFSKASTALTGPYDDIVIPRGIEDVDAEAELAVVIGSEIKGVRASEALGFVAGFMVMNDVSARKAQREDRQWFRAKSFDTFAPCGPWIVTADELTTFGDLRITQTLNGKVMQDSRTSDLIADVPHVIEYVSAGMTLEPGDIISTGTPAGVGVYHDPPVFLAEGDVVEIEIEKIGLLRNRIRTAG
ncbi:MAG TPA: fumarylacetoacetate hydrolase family protein [Candidatus Krumholzibacterium sp.]|nr:fumarylacetoacetate hydrolase family protein [Candidatus Krumholzibacterium sp.]